MEKEEQKLLEEVSKEVAERVTPAITEKVLAEIAAKMPNRKIFGDGDSAEKALEAKKQSAEYLKEWYKKDMTTGGSGSGAELVPTFLSDQFIGVAQNYGLVRKQARHWPMEGMKEAIPTLDTVSAYRIDTDGNKIQSSQPTTGALNLSSKTTGVIIPVSRKLLANASIQLVDALSFLAGKALAKLEDQWGLLGLASGEGIFQTSGVPSYSLATGNTTYDKVAAEDLLSLMEQVDESFFETGRMAWVHSLSVLNNFRKLRSVVGTDKQGFLFEGFGGQLPATMWDVPYNLSPIMPKNSDVSQAGKAFLALVNWDNVIFGDNRAYQMEVSNQATITDTNGSTLINLFEQNMVAIKITGDIDIQISNPTKAHAILKTSAS